MFLEFIPFWTRGNFKFGFLKVDTTMFCIFVYIFAGSFKSQLIGYFEGDIVFLGNGGGDEIFFAGFFFEESYCFSFY